MSVRTDPDLAITAWLDEEARDGAPEHLLEATRRHLERTNQRRVTWPAWRLSPMNMRLAVIAAVVVIAVLGGYFLLPRSNAPGVIAPSASPTASASTSPSPSPIVVTDGSLQAGTYGLKPLPVTAPGLRVAFTVPSGWTAFDGWALLSPRTTGAPSGSGIGFVVPSSIFSDPCHWDSPGNGGIPQAGDVAVGPTAADLANALASQTAYTSTAPVDVTLAGYSGKAMDIELPKDVNFATDCDKVTGDPAGTYWVWAVPGSQGNVYAQGPGERRRLWILDVEDKRIVVFRNFYEGTSAADQTEAEAIINSIVITP